MLMKAGDILTRFTGAEIAEVERLSGTSVSDTEIVDAASNYMELTWKPGTGTADSVSRHPKKSREYMRRFQEGYWMRFD